MKAYLISLWAFLTLTGMAHAQLLTLQSGYDPAVTPTAQAGYLILTNFADNSSYATTLLDNSTGDINNGVGGQQTSQPFNGPTGWINGANQFTLTWNPNSIAPGAQLASTATGNSPLHINEEVPFDTPVNYVQLSLSAQNGVSDPGFSVTNLTITNLSGSLTYLSPAVLTASSGGNFYQNNDILDPQGLLANGFVLSGSLNLNAATLGSYTSSHLDSVQIYLGYDIISVPEPTTWTLIISGLALIFWRIRLRQFKQ